MHIGNTLVSAPTCADDIAVIATSVAEAQGILHIINHHTKRELVKINSAKSDIIIYDSKKCKEEMDLKLGDGQINRATSTKHLGIIRQENNKISITERIQLGRATIYSLLGAGLHVRKGFSPIVAYKLWKTYAVPRCIYGMEIMNINQKEMELLETAQRKILRQIQGLPQNVANTATYMLVGAEPLEITIDKNLLTFFMSICRNRKSIEYQILKRQAAIGNPNGNNFLQKIREILLK